MKSTQNYGLGKPESTEFYDVEIQNSNFDIVDEVMKNVEDKAESSQNSVNEHVGDTSNPHGVTKAQVGLENVPNVATNNQTPTYTVASTLTTLVSGEKLSTSMGKIMKAITELINHLANKSNPHGVTKSQVGLGNVENKSSETIRGELTKSNVTTALGYTPLNASLKGAANGVAELDSAGKVPSSQLPSYVDDVLEYSAKSSFPTTGETGKIYVDTSTNKTYRWSGSTYTEISASIALGETSSTAYRGDRGKAAYDHSLKTSGNPHGVTAAQIGALETTSVVDNLTSTATNLPLSANQGRVLKENIEVIGEVLTHATAGTGLGNGVWGSAAGITLAKGVYVISVRAIFDQNVNGYRGLGIGVGDDPVTYGRVLTNAVNGNRTTMSHTAIVSLDATTLVKAFLLQVTDTNTVLLVDSNITAVRIR